MARRTITHLTVPAEKFPDKLTDSHGNEGLLRTVSDESDNKDKATEEAVIGPFCLQSYPQSDLSHRPARA